TEVTGIYYLVSAILATFGSSSWNFLGAETWVFAHRRSDRSVAARYVRFLSLNLALLVARVPMLWVLTDLIGIHYAVSNLITLVAIFALRIGLADGWIWREGPFAAIQIKVSPVLAMSPHVVYTNIVEAFLRFLLVSKGYVLLHSAALVGEHGATLLSAQTDTGKTSTVITLVRNRGYRFLSDDMTIIDPA